MIESLCLALIWATRRLRHYVTKYSVHLISRLDSLRYLFDKLALGNSHELWIYNFIFIILATITLSPCLLHFIIFTFLLQFLFLSLVATFHISFTQNDDSSHINAYRIVIPLPSFHHLALIKRFQLERLSHGMGFHMFISDLREFIHSLQFLIGV